MPKIKMIVGVRKSNLRMQSCDIKCRTLCVCVLGEEEEGEEEGG